MPGVTLGPTPSCPLSSRITAVRTVNYTPRCPGSPTMLRRPVPARACSQATHPDAAVLGPRQTTPAAPVSRRACGKTATLRPSSGLDQSRRPSGIGPDRTGYPRRCEVRRRRDTTGRTTDACERSRRPGGRCQWWAAPSPTTRCAPRTPDPCGRRPWGRSTSVRLPARSGRQGCRRPALPGRRSWTAPRPTTRPGPG